ncbi:MAG: hypothetical protein ABIS92_04125 [Polyangia bacterium]
MTQAVFVRPAPFPLLALFTLIVLGCGPTFDPVARLTKLRVLALRAEPINPQLGELVTLEPLIYAPPEMAGQPFTYSWSWCPYLGSANDGYACPLDDASLHAMGREVGVSEIPSLALGTDGTATFRNPFPSTVLAALCDEGFEAIPSECDGGFPIRIKFSVAVGEARQTATTLIRLPTAAGVPPNTNPAFDAAGPPLTALVDGVEQPIDDQAAVSAPRLKETKLRAHVADLESETYVGRDEDGAPASLREGLTLSWYVETGDVAADAFHTGYFPGTTQIEQFLSNSWTPEQKADYPRDQARIIVVLRDNRGGVAWTSGTVALEPTP